MIRLENNMTAQGWLVESISDLLVALEAYPEFNGIGEEFIAEAIEQVGMENRAPVFESVDALADHIIDHYF